MYFAQSKHTTFSPIQKRWYKYFCGILIPSVVKNKLNDTSFRNETFTECVLFPNVVRYEPHLYLLNQNKSELGYSISSVSIGSVYRLADRGLIPGRDR
jgi:hypothetical protein